MVLRHRHFCAVLFSWIGGDTRRLSYFRPSYNMFAYVFTHHHCNACTHTATQEAREKQQAKDAKAAHKEAERAAKEAEKAAKEAAKEAEKVCNILSR